MSNDSIDVEQLANWSQPKEIETKYGPRLMRRADLPAGFWDIWKAHKDALKANGLSVGKDKSDKWELTLWQPLSAELQQQRQQSIEDSKASSADIELPRPDGLDYMPFQKAGIRYALARPNVLIGDEMGLGKTIQAIGILNTDETIDSAIIVCPKSLKLNWKRELDKWQTRGLSVGVVNGGWPDTQIVILNYEQLGKFDDKIQAQEWGCCILDEAHLIKNRKAQRSQHAKAIKARRKIRLTGTPIVNRPIELYNLISDMADFGSFFAFAKRYAGAVHNGWGWDFSGAANLDELQRRLRETIMVRRLKMDVLTELPRKIRQIVEIEADTPAQKKAVKAEQVYEAATEEKLAGLRVAVELAKADSEDIYKAAVARLTEASKVVFVDMARLRHETAVAKIPAVIEHVRAALEDNDNKVIIAVHHHDMGNALMAGLSEFKPVMLTGENNEQQRQSAVDSFQNDPAVRVFVGSIMAAGVGITLTASSHVVFAELDWVPGNMSQMEDRAHRIGQTETVLVQHIVLSESLDARMARILVSKQAVIESALDKDHPERTAPVYAPKTPAATQSDSQAVIAQVAETLTPEQVVAVHTALKLLAGLDGDRAAELNGMGYNKLDTAIGHSLANQQSLTAKQAALGLKLARKYRRQLPAELLPSMGVETSAKA